jgi:uncharacterized membrane protein YhiD involved in acid resistance
MNASDFESLLNVNPDNLSLLGMLISLTIGLILSICIRWHFVRYGSTLSNREEFGQVFPFILLTTVLIIAVVKSSLALSLGLVGALSIVRFRTPIKEPEELAYLFISIAAGLGLGANQTIVTVVSVLIILLFMAIINKSSIGVSASGKKLFISIDLESSEKKDQEGFLDLTNSIMKQYTIEPDLRRFDIRDKSIEMLYLVNLSEEGSLDKIVKAIKSTHPDAGVTFLDQNNLPGV